MGKKENVFLVTLLFAMALALVAHGTPDIRDLWLGAYPDACSELVAAANSCDLCHGSGLALNPYSEDIAQFGIAAIEGFDSDGDTVNNLDEILACTLPGDPTSVSPTDSATWSGIKALYN